MSYKRSVWILALLAMGCRTGEDSRPGEEARTSEFPRKPGGTPGESMEQPEDSTLRYRQSEQSRLETAYEALDGGLDSLWRDSLDAAGGPKPVQYRRRLAEARTVRDNTKVFLEELRVSSEGVTPEIWEKLRASAELSLDSLRRLLISADSARN